jgi:hypothetical protein
MRRLVLASMAATMLGIAVPASAQTVYVDDGYRSAYSEWSAPRAGIYVGAPRADVYVYEDAPRYRYRHYNRDWGSDAYAYSGGPAVRYRSWDGPTTTVVGGQDASRYRDRHYDRDWGGAYVYSGGPAVRYRSWNGPTTTVVGGYRDWDNDYSYRKWDRW